MRTRITQIAALILLTASQLMGDDAPVPLTQGDTETGFNFETDEMEGTIRLDGAYHGISRLVDKRTGMQVIDSRYSALNLFKLMSVNQVMGQPRHMDRTITSGPDWVEVTYSAFDLSLFGDDFRPGDERTVRVRLALTPPGEDLAQPLEVYRAFLDEQIGDLSTVSNEGDSQ